MQWTSCYLACSLCSQEANWERDALDLDLMTLLEDGSVVGCSSGFGMPSALPEGSMFIDNTYIWLSGALGLPAC